MSGGEDTRLRLAELFSEDTELYILDEPTSHLDVEGANYLNNRLAMTDSFILVSHNRELLDCNCNKIIEIDGGRIKEFTGNYTEYLEQKKKAYEHAVEEYEQYTEEVKRLTKVYAKKREKARKLEKDPRGISKSEAKGIATMALRRSPEGKANVLILDEPTNYLDIPSVEAIQELLMEYEGTMLFVSHDNEFVKAIATDVIRIENMKLINEIR